MAVRKFPKFKKSMLDIPLNVVQIITNRSFSSIKKGDAQVTRMIMSLLMWKRSLNIYPRIRAIGAVLGANQSKFTGAVNNGFTCINAC